MKSLMLLWKEVLNESGTWCHTSTSRDFQTVSARFEHEGLSFLTISLPNFGKEFERALDQGQVTHDQFPGFARTGGLPRLLSGFLEQVFDRRTGVLLPEPSITAIRVIRQLTLMFGKILLPCTTDRNRAAVEKFMECESDLLSVDEQLTGRAKRDFGEVANVLFRHVFRGWDADIRTYSLMPKHGPGATADKLRGNSKWNQHVWHERLEPVFPMVEYLLPTYGYWPELDRVEIREPGAEQPVKVTLVPKTLKTPRIIAIEPTCMQYMQQAMLDSFMRNYERDDILPQFIGFEFQEPNRLLAREGSREVTLATLDLSEASDRVSNQLVKTLTSGFPHLYEGLQASRSTHADVPHFGVIPLRKYASMGSALCFPLEALVFLTCIFLGISRQLSTPVTRELLEGFVGKVRVYGDDMIVPVEYVESVVLTLESYGFKVNQNKSFWTGKFRESCGGDYYDGHEVNPVRVRRVLPEQRSDVDELISTVALRNNLYYQGYFETCSWLDTGIEALIKHFPRVLPGSPILGRHDHAGFDTGRHDEHLNRPLVKGYVVSPTIPVNPLEGSGALLKFFLLRKELPLYDGHLERSGRPAAVDIKLRWGSPV